MNERTQQMVDMYVEEGCSYAQIAERFKISRQRVQQLVRPHIDKPHYGRNRLARFAERRREIAEANARLHAGESTYAEEVKRLGLAESSLTRLFYRYGLKMPPGPPSPQHGTYYRYQKGCRCDECKAAMRRKWRERQRRGPRIHGTASAYRNFGCRCEPCKAAGAIENRLHRQRRKQRKRERMPED